MEPILAALEVESFGKPVRVEFTKTDGVISHTIFLVNGDEKMPVLTSQFNAPGLPCFTELHQQDDLLFLTGADGPCHWSMSVQVGECSKTVLDLRKPETGLFEFSDRIGLNRPARNIQITRESQFLFFDVACRLKSPTQDLRCEYRAIEDSCCGRLTSTCFATNSSNVEAGTICFGEPPKRVEFLPKSHCAIDCISSYGIKCAPLETEAETLPVTLRWSYPVWRMG